MEELKAGWTASGSADDGRVMKEGIKTVIVGKPNAGKSSILNMLLGEERAIVTDIAGTNQGYSSGAYEPAGHFPEHCRYSRDKKNR